MLAETFPTPVMHHEGTKETRPAEGQQRQRLDRRRLRPSFPGHRPQASSNLVHTETRTRPGLSAAAAEANSGKPEARAEGMRFRGANNVISLSLRFGLRSRYFLVIAANARQQEI